MAVGSGGGARRAWLRHGPAVPGFVPCGVGRGRDRRRGGGGLWSRPPPRLACPPHPVQVPSASRRGGLKTPWGVARPPRVGAVGPVGRSPFSPRLRRPPPPGGRGCRATPRSLRPSGGGYPAAVVPCVRVCPASSVCGGGRWEPPGRLWGCPSSPLALGGAGWMPRCPTFPTFSESDFVCVYWPARGTLRGMCCARGGASPPGVGPL